MRHLPLTPDHELPWPAVLMALVLTLTAVAHAHPERLRPLATHLHHTAAAASVHLR